MSGNDSYFEHLQKCYSKLRRCRLVKQSPVVTDDSLQHFAAILNEALPRAGVVEEELVDHCVKAQYFWNPRGYIRGLHPNNKDKNNMRKDARCFVLLTIGLEIVREFELERVIRLSWNKDNHEYEAVSLIDPANPPDAKTFHAEQRAARAERNGGRKRRDQNSEAAAPEPNTPEPVENDNSTQQKSWGDSSAN